MNKEQAAKIYDLETYKEVTGAKRFKRTKEEMDLGLSPEEALQRRLESLREQKLGNKDESPHMGRGRKQNPSKSSRRASTSRKGDIVVHIRPVAGVDPVFFEHLPEKNNDREIILDEKWYSWLDNKLDCPYYGDITKLLEHVLEMGMGEVITRYQLPEDLND